ncbi:N-acetyltransferase [Falsirhodobacter halotolerans]|uniref:N-acetyltransferase n=1 Tax=Falsirhodobacter halotolerans TaxID=1146892 RepID=UPI001FD23E0E|nr:N-acetyltransferase [Falsirhodobacter halotolerans]MCJ8140972.1 N-acetyltransferase [Falsirhodobacter halotolerans]
MTRIAARECASVAPEGDGDLNLDSFRLRLSEIGPTDGGRLHQMTVGVGWPHRLRDVTVLLDLGRGLIGMDEIDRPVCTAMFFPWGDDFATLGMMTTTPRLQAQGAGRWLLRQVLAECGGRDVRLYATRAGYSLYREGGFTPVRAVHQMQGVVTGAEMPDALPGLSVRPVGAADLDAMRALDLRAFGAPRDAGLVYLLSKGDGLIACEGDRPVGYALRRRFGKGTLIGPVVAESDDIALRLIAPLIAQGQGGFVRLDMPDESGRLMTYLQRAGLAHFDSVTEMRIGPERRQTSGAVTFGLAAHSLG